MVSHLALSLENPFSHFRFCEELSDKDEINLFIFFKMKISKKLINKEENTNGS